MYNSDPDDFPKEPGLSYAEIARQLGVSHVAVSKMMKKENRS